jgi:hypothetical protein
LDGTAGNGLDVADDGASRLRGGFLAVDGSREEGKMDMSEETHGECVLGFLFFRRKKLSMFLDNALLKGLGVDEAGVQ